MEKAVIALVIFGLAAALIWREYLPVECRARAIADYALATLVVATWAFFICEVGYIAVRLWS